MLVMTPGLAIFAQPMSSNLPAAVVEPAVANRSLNDWLIRMHEASQRRAYIGTFVVSTGDSIASARIWHVCEGTQQMERIESLTGKPRSTFRRNDQVITFLPESRVAVSEKRESLGVFPYSLLVNDSSISQFYRVSVLGDERVAGIGANMVQIWPQDSLRYGYRIWTEKETGLMLKVQTLDGAGHALEQAAFSELQLDVPVDMAKLAMMMANTDGYKVEKPGRVKTTALAEGWVLKSRVPGFEPVGCYRRLVRTGVSAAENTVQWVFSDGLASVSLFVESFHIRSRDKPGNSAIGATHTLTRRIGDWWLTAVGEVPPQTLVVFVQGLERTN
jgi:sigma-E factor negative regulatory protein RseB